MSLFNTEAETTKLGLEQVPSYMIAADNHNLGNSRGGSWFDPDTWGTKFENAGKLISTGMLSGVNSFYNTGVTVGNWLGADAEQRDTKSWISDIDSDLGKYYDQNRESADLVGFIAGSLLPGLGGIKVLNAGQVVLKSASKTGLIGENLSRATGLLVPQTEKYVALAAKDIASAQATFSAINQNGIKALMSGIGQNVLEGLAFETAVQATMFKSPILASQDGWDIVKNIAEGGVFQGVVGGAFSSASILGKIKKFVSTAEKDTKVYSGRMITAEGTDAADKLILLTEDKIDSIKRFEALSTDTSSLDDTLFKTATTAHQDKLRRIDNDIRATYQTLVGGHRELGNMLADAHMGLDANTALQNLLGAQEITPLGVVSKLETLQNKAAKEGKLPDTSISHSFVKLTGEDAGVVSDSAPLVWNISDRVKPVNGSIKEAVIKEARDQKFRPGQNWSIMSMTKGSSHYTAEARYIWADTILDTIKDGTAINQYDIPLLERALKDNKLNIKLVDDAGGVLVDRFTSSTELSKHIIAAKNDAAAELLTKMALEGKKDLEHSTQAVAKIVNTKLSKLEGTEVNTVADSDYFAWQSANREYKEGLINKGLRVAADTQGDFDTRFLPTHAKVSRVAPDLTSVNGHVIDGMTYIKQQQAIIKESVNYVVAKATGELYSAIPEITDAQLFNANKYGAGAGLTSFANGGYGTLESMMQRLGSLTKTAKEKFRGITEKSLEGKLFNLMSDQEATLEFSTINQKVTRSAEQWVYYEEAGNHYMITKKAAKQLKDEEAFVGIDEIEPEHVINIEVPGTAEFIKSHITRSGERTTIYKELHAAHGMENAKDPEVFRPIRPNPKDYPYFAFVKDPSVTGQGHTTMIWANTESKLAELAAKVPSKYEVLTRREVEEFKKARAEYDYQRTLHENYIDSDLKNSGIMSDFFTKTDPKKIADEILQQHLREDDMLAIELMRAKNQKAFDWLEDQGNSYTKYSASKLGTYSDRLELAGKNPYLDYIKTALDISKMGEHPWISSANKLLDGVVSRAVGHIGEVWNEWKRPLDDTHVEHINTLLDKYGMNTGYRDAALDLLVNHSAPKGELTKFIRSANAILSRLTIGTDPLNAINNFVGANILRGTELKQLTDAIKTGNSELAGELAQLAKINLPNEIGSILAPTKLVKQALTNFTNDNGTLLAKYKEAGYIKDMSEQFKSILDDFTLKGSETVAELETRRVGAFNKAKQLMEVGEKYSGNKFTEELNRFISANVADQITTLGVKHGLITPAEAGAYINTFVNRVEGNLIASQRPLMFQGPIGQAIGLFQSYQFNLMQQMFRYVAEGTKKDAAMLLGLQGTFYGLQGLPAFQFINQHVVGTMSGNQKHVDLYDSIYGVAGRDMGDLLVYGLPSNLLRTNLYSRGDINPRQVTVIPTNVADVPIVGAFTKFLTSVHGTVSKIANGGAVWESMLQGLEHNGLSRPLAGLAQTLQATGPSGKVFSTTNQGSILSSNDLVSWATLTRLAGGRPIDEAIVNDGVFRIQAYQQYDRARMKEVAGAIKSASIMGNVPDEHSVITFAKHYAEAGGKQAQFNKYMMNEFKSANTSQAEKISHQLQHPFSQKMQLLMGGGSDLSNPYLMTGM
jgi:hypothetical protein